MASAAWAMLSTQNDGLPLPQSFATSSSCTLDSPVFAVAGEALCQERAARKRNKARRRLHSGSAAFDFSSYGHASIYTLPATALASSWRATSAWPNSAPSPSSSSSVVSSGSLSAGSTSLKRPMAPLCESDEVAGNAQHPPQSARRAAVGDAAVQTAGQRIDKRSLDYVLRSGFAGGIAGCVAKTAIAPLDRVKILFQAQNPEYQKYSGKWTGVFTAGREIVRSDGIAALFQGHSATLLRIFPYAAIKYMAYDALHFKLMPTKEYETSARLFFAGAASGVTSVFVTYPLELIRVRLAFETKRQKQKGSLMRIIRKIYMEGATEAPFSGDARKRAAGRVAAAAAGSSVPAASASAANLSTSAVQHAAIANGATAASPVPTSPVPTTTAIATQRALQGFPILKFYRGFTVTVLGMIPYAGTSFLVFGRCKTVLQQTLGIREAGEVQERGAVWRPSKTTVDLSAGALAGAISQTAAYPFEVVRRRQQIGGIIRPGNILGVAETAQWIWRTSGWRGFYVGLSIGFLKVVPMTSISFAVWMGMKRQMGI